MRYQWRATSGGMKVNPLSGRRSANRVKVSRRATLAFSVSPLTSPACGGTLALLISGLVSAGLRARSQLRDFTYTQRVPISRVSTCWNYRGPQCTSSGRCGEDKPRILSGVRSNTPISLTVHQRRFACCWRQAIAGARRKRGFPLRCQCNLRSDPLRQTIAPDSRNCSLSWDTGRMLRGCGPVCRLLLLIRTTRPSSPPPKASSSASPVSERDHTSKDIYAQNMAMVADERQRRQGVASRFLAHVEA